MSIVCFLYFVEEAPNLLANLISLSAQARFEVQINCWWKNSMKLLKWTTSIVNRVIINCKLQKDKNLYQWVSGRSRQVYLCHWCKLVWCKKETNRGMSLLVGSAGLNFLRQIQPDSQTHTCTYKVINLIGIIWIWYIDNIYH